MKTKNLIVSVAACAVLGVNAASTADYVQDGLIANWDAIDNAGTGTHNPSATTWKNLVQGGMSGRMRIEMK